MAELLMEFPKLSVTIDGRKEPIMKRTCLIANTSNSIFVGIKLPTNSDTVYIDNAILTIGAGVPVYVPRPVGEEVDQQNYEMQNRVYARVLLMR